MSFDPSKIFVLLSSAFSAIQGVLAGAFLEFSYSCFVNIHAASMSIFVAHIVFLPLPHFSFPSLEFSSAVCTRFSLHLNCNHLLCVSKSLRAVVLVIISSKHVCPCVCMCVLDNTKQMFGRYFLVFKDFTGILLDALR